MHPSSPPRPSPRCSPSLVLVAACGTGARARRRVRRRPPGHRRRPPSRPDAPARRRRSPSASGFIPSVQFAQFYLAEQAGYYADAGLDVTLQNKIDPDLDHAPRPGRRGHRVGDGTSVIPAVSQGIPVVYTATIYGQFPAVVIAKAASGIKTAADLKGKKIGIPGKYGSSWIMLQALLQSAGLTPEDVDDRRVSRTSARRPRSSRARSTPRRASPTTSRSSSRTPGSSRSC